LFNSKRRDNTRLERFERTVLPHLPAAFNLARWLTGDRQDAEDIAQEASLRAFRSIDTLRGTDGRAWLLKIVRNTAFTFLGKKREQDMLIQPDAVDDRSAVDPEALALRAADVEVVRSALEAIPAEFREAIVLREMEQLSYKEIAEVTGAPIGTVMSRLARARKLVRSELMRSMEREVSL
jgi:RNA polymerase sigma-70 factor (ECF subfamily)